MNLNKVFLIGRLTVDPEIKTLPSGKKICQVGLATDRFFTNKEGQKKQETEFHNIVLFGKLAETVAKYLKKGSLLFIEGRLRTRVWEDEKGNKKTKTEIVAEKIQLGPKIKKETEPSSEEKIEEKEEIPIIEEEIDIEEIPF